MSNGPSFLQSILSAMSRYRVVFVISVATSGASGAGTIAALGAIHNTVVATETELVGAVTIFAFIVIGTILSDYLAQLSTSRLGLGTVASIRRDLGEFLADADLIDLENYGTPEILTVVTRDVERLRELAFTSGRFVIAIITLGAGVGFLGYLSFRLLLVTCVALGAGTAVEYICRMTAIKHYYAARRSEAELQKTYNTLADAAKELKLSHVRRHEMSITQVARIANEIAREYLRAASNLALSKSFGSLAFYVLVGIALSFLRPAQGMSSSDLAAVIVVLIFIRSAVEQVVALGPNLAEARVSFSRINEMLRQISRENLDTTGVDSVTTHFESIVLDGVTFTMRPQLGETRSKFCLGPIDISIQRGKIYFLTGANGSGKTTLLKVLLGLYPVESGRLIVNGHPASEAIGQYRQLFTCVFSDFYLFTELSPTLNIEQTKIDQYLRRLKLDHVVSITEGKFSTTALSTGQRKRLALLSAYIEDRPIFVFDEWAADQDPEFRREFYLEILPELKRCGKTVIAISHDDRYFHVADELIVMSSGRIVQPTVCTVPFEQINNAAEQTSSKTVS